VSRPRYTIWRDAGLGRDIIRCWACRRPSDNPEDVRRRRCPHCNVFHEGEARREEAAALAGVSERSIRKWASTGKLTRHPGADGRPRYDRGEVAAFRHTAEGGSGIDSGTDSAVPESAGDSAHLRGMETALRVHAARRSQLEDEVTFLRGQLIEAQRANAELRVLLQNAQRETSLLSERLPLPKPAPRRRFWLW